MSWKSLISRQASEDLSDISLPWLKCVSITFIYLDLFWIGALTAVCQLCQSLWPEATVLLFDYFCYGCLQTTELATNIMKCCKLWLCQSCFATVGRHVHLQQTAVRASLSECVIKWALHATFRPRTTVMPMQTRPGERCMLVLSGRQHISAYSFTVLSVCLYSVFQTSCCLFGSSDLLKG